MSKSKIDLMRAGATKQRRELTDEEREDLGRGILGSKSSIHRVLFTLYAEDLDWLRQTTNTLKRARRRTAKSELMRLGISLMKEKSDEELLSRLRNLE